MRLIELAALHHAGSVFISLDLPAHGADQRASEQNGGGGLIGWKNRIRSGEGALEAWRTNTDPKFPAIVAMESPAGHQSPVGVGGATPPAHCACRRFARCVRRDASCDGDTPPPLADAVVSCDRPAIG